MANVLKREKQITVLRCLVEGNSIRSTERLTGVHRDTVMRTLVRFGDACGRFLDHTLSNIFVSHVQLDETWCFVRKKEKNLRPGERRKQDAGDFYLFTALDHDSKLIVTHLVGKRTDENTRRFVDDLRNRIVFPPGTEGGRSPQVSTDGWPSYPPSIRGAFGRAARHGVMIKRYRNPEVGRYSPPDLRNADRINIRGITDLWTICTSHVERCNLTIRTFLRRFTRLSVGFSKKLENLTAAVALHVAYYNFVWRLRGKGTTGKLLPTPAMQAGIVDHLWRFEDLYNAVTDRERDRVSLERYKRLGRKLFRGG